MNPWQIAKQLSSALTARTWPDGATEKVFGRVLITDPALYVGHPEARFPVAIVRAAGAPADPELPDRLLARFAIHLFAEVPQDLYGVASTAGGARTNLGSSGGRGVLELDEEARAAIAAIAPELRLNLRPTESQDLQVGVVENRVLAERIFEVEALARRDRFYHPATFFRASVAGPNVTLTWTVPPSRWDRKKVILRRSAGATPPATATAGTGVALAGDLSTSVVDAPGAGQQSYALFAAYDENGDGTEDRYSASATKTVTV